MNQRCEELKQWRRNNPDKVKAQNQRRWIKIKSDPVLHTKYLQSETKRRQSPQRQEYNTNWKLNNKDYIAEYNKEWNKNNPNYFTNEQFVEKRKELDKQNRIKNKTICLSHYGLNGMAKCVCCGEGILSLLTLDHQEENGALHRKNNPLDIGQGLYRKLIKNEFPKGYQTLCWSCNSGKHFNDGKCPHTNFLDIGDELH